MHFQYVGRNVRPRFVTDCTHNDVAASIKEVLPTEEMNPVEMHCEVKQERCGITKSLRQLTECMIRKEVAEMEIARIQAKHRRLSGRLMLLDDKNGIFSATLFR
ncbi:hypothetical protein Tco_1424896 [Tanacetum coccineum]